MGTSVGCDVKLVDGQCTSSDMMGVCQGNLKIEDGVCKPKYSLGSVKMTPSGDWGGGNSEHLDKHTLDCGSNCLNQFQLTRPTDTTLSYRYKCLAGIDSPANIVRSTPSDIRADASVIYLDKHDVDCGTNPIAKFKLNRPTPDMLSYDYTCNSMAAAGQCRDVVT